MEAKTKVERQDNEIVLYSSNQHIISRLTDIIVSSLVFISLLAGGIFIGFLRIFFFIALILPVVYLIYRVFKREKYIVTNKRFIRYVPGEHAYAIPIKDIIDVKFPDGGSLEKKGHGKINLITNIKHGEGLIIEDKAEYGLIRLIYVERPLVFRESLLTGKISSGSILTE
ncbi:MAG: hypothetical protein ACUVWP_03375 [bacterium]